MTTVLDQGIPYHDMTSLPRPSSPFPGPDLHHHPVTRKAMCLKTKPFEFVLNLFTPLARARLD